MSNFISKADYGYQIREERLNQILEEADVEEEDLLDDAELEAISIIKDALAPKYDVELIFSQTGAARHKTILRWAKVLVIYFIYERIPDDMVPERVVKNYNQVLERLEAVAQGTENLNGAPLVTVTAPDGESVPQTRRRWGSIKKRSNDGGNPRALGY